MLVMLQIHEFSSSFLSSFAPPTSVTHQALGKAQEILLARTPCSSLVTHLLSALIPTKGTFVYRPEGLVVFFHFWFPSLPLQISLLVLDQELMHQLPRSQSNVFWSLHHRASPTPGNLQAPRHKGDI